MNQEDIDANIAAGLVYTGWPYIDVGTKVFMVINDRRIGKGSIIVECVVEETNDVYSIDNEKTVWCSRSIQGDNRASIPNGETDELGWPKYNVITIEEFLAQYPNARRCNQFLWMDEPVGHGVGLGDDGVVLTLNEAMAIAKPSKKKHLKRRLKARRNMFTRYITATWKMNGYSGSNWPKFPEKKIYVRRK